MALGGNFRRVCSTSNLQIKKNFCSTTLQTPKNELAGFPINSKSESKKKGAFSSNLTPHERLGKGSYLKRFSSFNKEYSESTKYSKEDTIKTQHISMVKFTDAISWIHKPKKNSSHTKQLSVDLTRNKGSQYDFQRNLPRLELQKTYDEAAKTKRRLSNFVPTIIAKNKYYEHNFVLNAKKDSSKSNSILLSIVMKQLRFLNRPKKPKVLLTSSKAQKDRSSDYKMGLMNVKNLKLVPNKFQDPIIQIRLDKLGASIKKLRNIRIPSKRLNVIIIK